MHYTEDKLYRKFLIDYLKLNKMSVSVEEALKDDHLLHYFHQWLLNINDLSEELEGKGNC